jgi:hypothetical protein
VAGFEIVSPTPAVTEHGLGCVSCVVAVELLHFCCDVHACCLRCESVVVSFSLPWIACVLSCAFTLLFQSYVQVLFSSAF